jgi:hypothetical protein
MAYPVVQTVMPSHLPFTMQGHVVSVNVPWPQVPAPPGAKHGFAEQVGVRCPPFTFFISALLSLLNFSIKIS